MPWPGFHLHADNALVGPADGQLERDMAGRFIDQGQRRGLYVHQLVYLGQGLGQDCLGIQAGAQEPARFAEKGHLAVAPLRTRSRK